MSQGLVSKRRGAWLMKPMAPLHKLAGVYAPPSAFERGLSVIAIFC